MIKFYIIFMLKFENYYHYSKTKIFEEVGLKNLRNKSTYLTAYLEFLLNEKINCMSKICFFVL